MTTNHRPAQPPSELGQFESERETARATSPVWAWLRRSWPVLRYVFFGAFAVAAVVVLTGHRSELQQFSGVLANFQWWWIPVALVVEAASQVATAGMQFRLLASGGVRTSARPLLLETVASQAILNSVFAGSAFAAVYGFRWFRRFGADDATAGWAVVGTWVAAGLSLAMVAAGGVALATGEGASLDLIPVVIGVLAVSIAIGALFVYERPLEIVLSWLVRTSRRLTGRPKGNVAEQIDSLIKRVTAVRLRWRDLAAILAWGIASWLLDCSCFAISFLAVGAPIPWEGILLAYGAGQLAANLPITPGGLGAVEGTLQAALIAFGGAEASTFHAVIVYRLMSFWLIILVGWFCYAGLALGVRRGRWARQVMAIHPSATGPGEDGVAGWREALVASTRRSES